MEGLSKSLCLSGPLQPKHAALFSEEGSRVVSTGRIIGTILQRRWPGWMKRRVIRAWATYTAERRQGRANLAFTLRKTFLQGVGQLPQNCFRCATVAGIS